MPYIRKPPIRRMRIISQLPRIPIWTEPGGIVWMGVAVWLLYMIALWGVLGIPRQYKGVSYEIQERRLREVDIRRVLAGQSVSDGLGNAIIDPLEDQIEIVVVDSSGESTWDSLQCQLLELFEALSSCGRRQTRRMGLLSRHAMQLENAYQMQCCGWRNRSGDWDA